MSHTSPATYLVWSILSTFFGIFLLHHLWCFDRFRCLKWSNGPYSGAFKRIMTYTYLMTIPLISIYTYAFAYIKYNVGYTFVPGIGSVPTPYQLWPESYQKMIFPLSLVFSLGWACELITHLEELCFWYFLVNAGPTQPDWFSSIYFRVWAGGAVVAFTVMPVATSVTRHNPLQSEAAIFLTGSIGGLALTLCFIPILFTFPTFLRKIKQEGVDSEVLIRLTKFYDLNVLRVAFRFLFVVPFLILGSDGLRPHVHVNDNLFATDILAFVGSIGCVVSSTITLLIFFPRSYADEFRAQDASFHHAESVNSYIAKDSKRVFTRSGHMNSRSPFSTRGGNNNRRRFHTPSSYSRRSPHETQDSHITRESYVLTDSPAPQNSALPFVDSFNLVEMNNHSAHQNPEAILGATSQSSHVLGLGSVDSTHKLRGLSGYEANQLPYAFPSTERKLPAIPHPGTGMPNMGFLHTGTPLPSLQPTTLPMSTFSPTSMFMDKDDKDGLPLTGLAANKPVVLTTMGTLTHENVHRHTITTSSLNPLIHNFTSPLDFLHQRRGGDESPKGWPQP